ncbi:hypothetical protein [Celeribacter sp.]|uniref:hypothetical protein n=1 Tax=Celeribacter sp. TaxID=1890673 RepID=UPI003A915753
MSESTTPKALFNPEEMPEDFTYDEIIAGMTKAEVEALSEGEDALFEAGATQNAEPEAEENPDGEVNAAQPEGEGDKPAAQTPSEPDADPKEEAPKDEAVKEEPAPTAEPEEEDFTPPTNMPTTAQMKELETTISDGQKRLSEIMDKFEDGDMSREEYQKEVSEVSKVVAKAEAQLETESETVSNQREAVVQNWHKRVSAFHEKHPVLITDTHLPHWDALLKSINSNPSYATMPFQKRIDMAAAMYEASHKSRTGEDLGLISPTKADPKPDPAPKAEEKPKEKEIGTPNTEPREAPQTLANITGDAASTADDSAFAAIDAANPLEAEKMFSRLSPEAQAAFLGRG